MGDARRVGDTLPGGGRVVLAALVVVLAAFWPTLVSFHRHWTTAYASPGYVVAAITLWLVWRDGRHMPGGREGWPAALVLLAGVSVLWMVAQAVNVQVVHQGALVLVLLAWSVSVFGLGSLRYGAPIAATFLLAVPIWGALVRPLQVMTAFAAGRLVKLLGIEAVIAGETISIRTGTFIVEGSCAGLSFFVAGLVVGTFYSHLFMRGWKTRVGVVVLSGVVAILSNWVRVAFLIVLGDVTAMQSPIIYDHGWVGWVVFTIALIPFFFLARKMERWNEAPGPAALPARPRDPRLPRRVAVATAVAVVGPVLFFSLRALPSAGSLGPGLAPVGPGWTAAPAAADLSWEPEYPVADLTERAAWTRGATTVRSRRLVYREQRQGEELVNSMNRIAPDSLLLVERAVGPVDGGGRRVREAWVRTADGITLVWYWYRVGGGETISGARAKLLELAGFLTLRRQAELVMLATPCAGDDCEPAARALAEFLQPAHPEEAEAR